MSGDSREAERLRRVYGGYAADERIQSEWSADNQGNRAILAERRQAVHDLLQRRGVFPPADCRVLDVGCGRGGELAQFVVWGASPTDVVGIDLLEGRLREARDASGLRVICADAARSPFSASSFDVALAYTVFSSILDDRMAADVASEIDRVLKPGGFVIWYDTRVRNPWNPHTRPVPRSSIERLFDGYRADLRSITLMPQLARRLGRFTSVLYRPLAVVAPLRTHYIGALEKPA